MICTSINESVFNPVLQTSEEHGVTLKQPPKIPLFSQFFRGSTNAPTQAPGGTVPTTVTPSVPIVAASQTPPMYYGPPMGMYPPYPPSPWMPMPWPDHAL